MKQILFILLLLLGLPVFGQKCKCDSAESLRIDKRLLRHADDVINQAIEDKEIPGAVLAVVHQNRMVYLKAYGNKDIYPDTVQMKTNTIFDLASLTKSVSTATSVMILVERGKIRLNDPVSMFIPEFKDDILVIHLLTHTSGLPSYAPVELLEKKLVENPNVLIQHIATVNRNAKPGEEFKYSCLNFISLQHIVEKVSGQSLRDFAKESIFDVLGMRNTDYLPEDIKMKQIAPTEKKTDNQVLLGDVHDPLARILKNGISGNAGLFSDARDLALFATMMLNDGTLKGKRVLSPLTVRTMTTVPFGFTAFGRTPGWDMYSSFSSNQGDLLGPNTYGHTGYTGTSIVIDPDHKIAVILLTNRVHPDDKGSVSRLRSLVANAVAGAVKM
jgi:CubicO group peptidase (beta-lactamase class C family)